MISRLLYYSEIDSSRSHLYQNLYLGKNVNLMSIKDFYNAVTPGSSITHGTGLKSEADYIKVADNDICSDNIFLSAELPIPNSTLNKVKYFFIL